MMWISFLERIPTRRVPFQHRRTSTANGPRAGMVLVVVLVLVLLMGLAAFQYLLGMETENMAAQSNGERLQARQAAFSARDFVAYLLEQSRETRQEMGGLQGNPSLFAGPTLVDNKTTPVAEPWASSRVRSFVLQPSYPDLDTADPDRTSFRAELSSRASRPSRPSRPSVPSASRGMNGSAPSATIDLPWGVVNESAKLHLGLLVQWDAVSPGTGRMALLRFPGMDEATADAILDWIDHDDEPRELGAEAEAYRDMDPPLVPRNGLPSSLDELLLVRGVTNEKLFGAQEPESNQRRGLEDHRPDMMGAAPMNSPVKSRDVSDSPVLPWSAWMTVHSSERNETVQGSPRIFVNDASLVSLHQALLDVVSVEVANYLVLYRQYGDQTPDTSKPGGTAPTTAEQVQIDLAVPAQTEIQSLIELVDKSLSFKLQGRSVVVSSPWSSDKPDGLSGLPLVLDLLTVERETRLAGRVNLVEAPPEVLLALPGMDEEIVEQILVARQGGANPREPERAMVHAMEILLNSDLDISRMKKLLPWITIGGDVVSAEFLGQIDETSPYFRFEAILDGSVQPVQQVYYREIPADRTLAQRLRHVPPPPPLSLTESPQSPASDSRSFRPTPSPNTNTPRSPHLRRGMEPR